MTCERRVRQPQCELCEQVFSGKESFDTMTFFAGGIDDENGRRPLRVEACSQALEFVGLVADVDTNRDEMMFDESHHTWVGIHLGIQPGTAASHGSGRKVEQDVPVARSRVVQCCFEVVPP